jgi:phytoene dehydrogenase-like protein
VGLTGAWDERESDAFADRVEAHVERFAPGFRNRIRARHIFDPPKLQAANANLVGGALNGGTAQIHQQLVFRPATGLGRPETPIAGLYLASASAHPGGGVHGACGANAARAALASAPGLRRALASAVTRRAV